MAEGGILREDFEKLPPEVRRKWLSEAPALLGDKPEIHGFESIIASINN